MDKNRRQSRISMVPSFCCAFGGISWVQFIMSCSNRTSHPGRWFIDNNCCDWAEHWKKNGRYASRDTTKWFWSMKTLDNMLKNQWKATWKRSNGKSYPSRRIDQIFPLPIINCSGRLHMAWQSGTSILMKMRKNGSTLG